MAYYKVLIEVWCDWDAEESDLEEIARRVALARTLSVLFGKSSPSYIVHKTSRMRRR